MASDNSITVNGQPLKDYLDNTFVEQFDKENKEESKNHIGIARRLYLRYPGHKEENGKGRQYSRAEINKEFYMETLKNLDRIDAPLPRFIFALFLTGKDFTTEDLINTLKEEVKKKITIHNVHTTISQIKKSKVGILLKKNGKKPIAYGFDKRALEMTEVDLYELYKKNGSIDLESACYRYPFLIDILKENDIGQLPQKITNQAEFKSLETKADKGIEEKLPLTEAIKTISDFIDSTGGKFDVNVNINFRIIWK